MNPDGHYSGKKGEAFVTMADEYWIGGNFHFKAMRSGSDRVIEVEDGFFRVANRDTDKY